jgi:predicted TIM-barrel fold metal-dependent hydrolase
MNRRSFLGGGLEALAMAGTSSAAASASAAPAAEEPIDPSWPIIDAHHHLWDFPARGGNPPRRFMLSDLLKEIDAGGHHITQTVAVECMSTYRADGPPELRSLGETEFVTGIAAQSASGNYGPCRVAAGFVGFVDLRLGEAAKPVLEAHVAAAGGRLKGIRNATAWDPYPVMGMALDRARFEWLTGPSIRAGVAALAAYDLAFETWVFHTQIPQVADLAAAVPKTTIVLGHCGTPVGVGPSADDPRATFASWKRNLVELARRPNVVVKLGGLGMRWVSPALAARTPQAGSAEIAAAWRPVIETCIEAFGPQRCLFESNFPPDGAVCSYGTMWNALKRLASGYSADERTALFSGTASRVFRLQGDGLKS